MTGLPFNEEDAAEKVRETIAFQRSAILSGENWTETAALVESEGYAALAALLVAYKEATQMCGVGSESGPNRELLLCGYKRGHEGPHSWGTLPTFPLAAEADLQAAKEALEAIAAACVVERYDVDRQTFVVVESVDVLGIARSVLARLSTGTQDGQEVIEGETPDTKGRVFELAAIVARLVCVEDAQHVDDRDAHRRLDLAANKLGHLLRLPEPEFAEVWSSPPGIQDGGEG